MASYEIEWRRSTKGDLKSIPHEQVARIIQKIGELTQEPRPSGCAKLTGSDCAYRIRVGDYRVIYEIYDARVIIEVIKVAHRKDIYR